MSLSPHDKRALLIELRKAHIARTSDLLSSESSKALLRTNIEAALEAILDAKIGETWDAARVTTLVESAVRPEAMKGVVRPVIKTGLLLEIARLREDTAPVGAMVPEEARAVMLRLLERPGLLPKKLVQQIVEHEAVETLIREMVENALREFQTKVNPFSSDWGLPALLKKMSPLGLGLGALSKSFEGIQREFEKRLEPEMARFIANFSQRAIAKTADAMSGRADQPAFVSLRKELFTWMLGEPKNELLGAVDDEALALGEEFAHIVLVHVLNHEDTKRQRKAFIEMTLAAHKAQTLREALATYGITPAFDFVALTAVVWGPLQVALATDTAKAFIETLIGGFYDEQIAACD